MESEDEDTCRGSRAFEGQRKLHVIAEVEVRENLAEEEIRRLTLVRALVEERKRQNLTQEKLAARMKIAQPTLAHMESKVPDSHISTIHRYAECLGKRIVWQIVDK